MLGDVTIGVGTVGAGLWFSFDGGDRWRHVYKHLDPEGNVRTVLVDPGDPATVWAASDFGGLFVSRDRGYRWEPVSRAMADQQVWSLAVDRTDPDRMFVGGRPGLFRSVDGGASFEVLDTGLGAECPIGTPRITNVVLDPRDPATVWMGVEVDGLYRSTDGGDSWTHLGPLGETAFHGDIHGLAVRPTGDGGAQVMATTPFGLATSTDEGETWAWRSFDGFDKGSGNPFAYCRGVFVDPTRADTILLGCGDYIPGRVGAVEVSRDGGETWSRAELPVEANSTVYWMATHPEVPGAVVAATVFGQVFVSSDAGESWGKLDREFGEIRSVSLAPA